MLYPARLAWCINMQTIVSCKQPSVLTPFQPIPLLTILEAVQQQLVLVLGDLCPILVEHLVEHLAQIPEVNAPSFAPCSRYLPWFTQADSVDASRVRCRVGLKNRVTAIKVLPVGIAFATGLIVVLGFVHLCELKVVDAVFPS